MTATPYSNEARGSFKIGNGISAPSKKVQIFPFASEFAQDIIDGLQARFPPRAYLALSAFDSFHLDFIPEEMIGRKS